MAAKAHKVSKRAAHGRPIHVHAPTWATRLYISLAAVLVPWTGYLSVTLPERHLSRHWDLGWVGLNAVMALSLLLTGLAAYYKSRWVVLFSTVAGTLLAADAWFDVVSERPGWELDQALFLALFIEIPLAVISFVLAYRTLNHNIN